MQPQILRLTQILEDPNARFIRIEEVDKIAAALQVHDKADAHPLLVHMEPNPNFDSGQL